MATETLKIKYIKDVDGNRIIPVTHEDAVFDSEGVNIGQKMAEVEAALDKLGTTEIRIAADVSDPVIDSMLPNVVYYKTTALGSLTINSFAQDGDNGTAVYTVLFMPEEATSLTLPSSVKWLNDTPPDITTIEDFTLCELSIRRVPTGNTTAYTAVLGVFTD